MSPAHIEYEETTLWDIERPKTRLGLPLLVAPTELRARISPRRFQRRHRPEWRIQRVTCAPILELRLPFVRSQPGNRRGASLLRQQQWQHATDEHYGAAGRACAKKGGWP